MPEGMRGFGLYTVFAQFFARQSLAEYGSVLTKEAKKEKIVN